jgi:cell division protein FtsB
MAKNRKNQSAAVRFGPALKAFIFCVIIGGSAVGYVWQKSQIDELGRQIKQRERRLEDLDNQNKKLRDHLAMLRSPAKLNERVLKLNLGLGMPQPNQVFLLPEPTMNRMLVESGPGAGSIAAPKVGSGLAMH